VNEKGGKNQKKNNDHACCCFFKLDVKGPLEGGGRKKEGRGLSIKKKTKKKKNIFNTNTVNRI